MEQSPLTSEQPINGFTDTYESLKSAFSTSEKPIAADQEYPETMFSTKEASIKSDFDKKPVQETPPTVEQSHQNPIIEQEVQSQQSSHLAAAAAAEPKLAELSNEPSTNGHTSNGVSSTAEEDQQTSSERPVQSAQYRQWAPPLQGKVALITGAGRGIGAGIARTLAEKGCKAVVINYSSSPDAAAQTCRNLEQEFGVKAVAIRADLTKVDEIVSLFQQAVDQAGGLDIVVSNSGREKFVPLLETTEQDFDEVLALNTRAQFFVAREALRHINENGTMVLMSSIAAGLGIKGHAIYGGSKSAVESFTRCFAQDFGIKKCTVNAIAPAGIKSDMWASNAWRYAPGCDKTSSVEQIEASLAAGSPLNRVGYPSDIGKVVSFLASDDGRWINGQIIPCNGGANV